MDRLGEPQEVGEPEPRPTSFLDSMREALGGRTPRVWVSAANGIGMELLREVIAQTLQSERIRGWVKVPDGAGRLRARLFEQGFVSNERPAESGWEIEIDAPRALLEPLLGTSDGAWLRDQLERPLRAA